MWVVKGEHKWRENISTQSVYNDQRLLKGSAMPETTPISLADLLIDAENPRLPQPNVGQREALRAIAKDQGKKLQVLARDILQHGLNPADLPIVMPLRDDLNRYVIVEGNRRLTALKALENPEFLSEAVSAGVLKEFRKLSKQYQGAPIETVLCVVVKDRDEARHWIELRHTGENSGAGIVPWGSDDAARYRARTVGLEVHSQALNFLERRGDLTPEARRAVPATSFKRLLETPAVRSKLGIEVRNRQLFLLADEDRVAKALLYVVQKLTSGETKVKDIYTRLQRIEYADDLPKSIVVPATANPREGVPATDGSFKAAVKAQLGVNAQKSLPRHRDKLIPRDCTLNVTDPRLRDMEKELRRLSLEDFTNAVSVLFRVFIELSADFYLDRMKLAVSADDSLSKKLEAAANDLTSRKKLTHQQAAPVRRACQRDSFLAPSVKLMHHYVHNKHLFPTPTDLRAHWDGLQPFVTAIFAP